MRVSRRAKMASALPNPHSPASSDDAEDFLNCLAFLSANLVMGIPANPLGPEAEVVLGCEALRQERGRGDVVEVTRGAAPGSRIIEASGGRRRRRATNKGLFSTGLV